MARAFDFEPMSQDGRGRHYGNDIHVASIGYLHRKKQKGIGEDRESGENCDSRFGDGCLHESFPKVLTLIS